MVREGGHTKGNNQLGGHIKRDGETVVPDLKGEIVIVRYRYVDRDRQKQDVETARWLYVLI